MGSFWFFTIVCWHIYLYGCCASKWGDLKENPKFIEVDCAVFPDENYCNNESNGWCKWNGSTCYKNYNSLLFSSSVDIMLISRGLSTYIYMSGLMILYWISGILVKKLKMFKQVDSDKLNKCQIYIFEVFSLSIGLAYILKTNVYGIFYNANDFADITPEKATTLTRGFAGALILTYTYAIEMLTNKLRWTLQMHHIVSIVSGMYYLFLMNDFVDFAALRCTLAMSLYSFTEHNVFIQLLIYRTYPLSPWKIHLASAIFYVLTRLFAIYTFIYCYYDWATSDEIRDQLNGKKPKQYAYLMNFFMLPIMNVLLNIAQFYSCQALFYLTLSVRKRTKQRNELRKYPRLQELYDIFIEFDEDDEGYWTMIDWKKFVFYHSTFIKHDTCIVLWNVLGFEYSIPEPQGIMEQLSDMAHQLSEAISNGNEEENDTDLTNKDSENSKNENLQLTEQEIDDALEVIDELAQDLNQPDEEQINIQMTAVSPDPTPVPTNINVEADTVENSNGFSPNAINEYEAHIQEKTKNNPKMASPVPKNALKKERYMRWKHFKRIFGPNLKSKQYETYTVKQVISATIQVLLKTIFSAQSDYESNENVHQRRNTMKKLYHDIGDLMGKGVANDSQMNVILEEENQNGTDTMPYQLNRVMSHAVLNDESIMGKQLQLNALVTQLSAPEEIKPHQTY